jgi:hypothetical protein
MTTYLPARTIKKLRNNVKPFGLMSKELQSVLGYLLAKGHRLMYFEGHKTWVTIDDTFCFSETRVYRLSKDADVKPRFKPRTFITSGDLDDFLKRNGTNHFVGTVINRCGGTESSQEFVQVGYLGAFFNMTTGIFPEIYRITVEALLPKLTEVTIKL